MGFGSYLGGSGGLVIAFAFAAIMNFGAFWFSDTVVLKMYRARPVDATEAPELYRIVHGLAMRAQIPMPKLYVIPQQAPNAFATGRDPQHAAVAATEGLLRLMDRRELEGVLAHELGHVKNRDTLISTVAATLAGVVMMLASMLRWAAIFGGVQRDDDDGGGLIGLLAMTILAPLAAMLIQFAISPGVPGRRDRRRAGGEPARPRGRAGEARVRQPARPDGRATGDGPSVHRESPQRQSRRPLLLDPSAGRRTGSTLAGDGSMRSVSAGRRRPTHPPHVDAQRRR
jgi:hypothetical protein